MIGEGNVLHLLDSLMVDHMCFLSNRNYILYIFANNKETIPLQRPICPSTHVLVTETSVSMDGCPQGHPVSSSLMSAMIQGQLYSDWLSNRLDAQSPRDWMNYHTLHQTRPGNVPQTQTPRGLGGGATMAT